MSKPVISIKGLSKSYMIGHEQQAAVGTLTFRDSLTGLLRKPLEIFTGHQLKKEKFWALKGLDLEIRPGEVVGIIGRNGSGKSTLLKILSRIVEPTGGEAIMHGRVASLLEVGTGFHPELTGRENVYFNGAILGMSRKEIKEKFDEIVAFSEVEQFLDTPVKFYSSGMYVRLAFAVAAHLDPDILIVDEVLAVGDAAFQKKCLGKMKDVAGQGRTVIFVSHSMQAVKDLCTRCVYLKQGEVVAQGDLDSVISKYLKSSSLASGDRKWKKTNDRFDKPGVVPKRIKVESAPLDPKSLLKRPTQSVSLEIDIIKPDPLMTIGFCCYDENDQQVFWTYPSDFGSTNPFEKAGTTTLKFDIPDDLNQGTYRLQLIGGLHGKEWFYEPGTEAPEVAFSIEGPDSQSALYQHKRPTIYVPRITWQTIS